MGAVWLGRDEVLGRAVAIKRLGAALSAGSAELERAEREARIAAHLNHPNVVSVFDLVTEGEVVWLVMEYVAGATLAEVIRRNGQLSTDDTAAVLGQVAEALAAAHGAGIVHRDVKPSNVLVGDDGSVKLSDFGIARTEADSHLTQTGLVTGSPAYLAPEVASGEPATSGSDVWSLGATAFHALTGRPPYAVGDNLMGALYRIVHEPPPRPEGADWLTPLVESTMVHDPARRWKMADIVQFLAQTPSFSPPPLLPAETTSAQPTVPAPEPTMSRAYPSAVTRHRPPPKRTAVGVVPLLVVAAVVALVVMVGLLIAQDDPARNDVIATPTSVADDPAADPDESAEASPSPTQAPSEAGIKQFISDYLKTASSDPDKGFTMLTSSFQSASPNYVGFWSSVQNPEITSISADADARTVTYVYEYSRAGQGRRSDEVSLQLVFRDGTYLIDGES